MKNKQTAKIRCSKHENEIEAIKTMQTEGNHETEKSEQVNKNYRGKDHQ